MTTVKLSSLRANSAADTDGEWIESRSFPGVMWKLRSLHYGPYTIARSQVAERLQRQHRKVVPPAVMTVEVGALFSKHILLDWKGLDEAYSAAKAVDVLTDPEFRELVADIEACAAEIGQAKVDFLEETSKNSGRPSASK